MSLLPKYKQISQSILTDIRKGQYAPCKRIPGERELAKTYNVSFMTARRTVLDLVELGVLERRGNRGTFIRPEAVNKLSSIVVNLIIPSYDSPFLTHLVDIAHATASTKNWLVEVTRIHPGRIKQPQTILESGQPCIVIADVTDLESGLLEAMQSPGSNSVIIGNDLTDMGIPSIRCDDIQGTKLAINCLTTQGHNKIALISDAPSNPMQIQQIKTWQELTPAHKDLYIEATTPSGKSPADFAYSSLVNHLEANGLDFTSILTLNPEASMGVFAAFYDMGYSCPNDVSIVCCGDSPILKHLRPAITSINPQIHEHIRQAFAILEKTTAQELTDKELLVVISPCLIERNSVRRPIDSTF